MTTITLKELRGTALEAALNELAALRIEVFRDFPYLYDGNFDYERDYLSHYRHEQSIIIGAYDGNRLIGAATAGALADHAEAFSQPLVEAGYDPNRMLYCGESVLLKHYRGQGIGHAFFDKREAHGRRLGKTHSLFCAVVRPDNHPLRPEDYQSLEPFWRKRGYLPEQGLLTHYNWKDIDQPEATDKPMQVWLKAL